MSRARLFSVLLLFSPAVPSAAADKMSFRNNTLPGHLTVHRIERQTKRVAPRREYSETLEYSQNGIWVQANLDEPKPGEVTVYQMFSDEPPELLSLFRGAERVASLPSAASFNIRTGSTYLNSERRTSRDSPFQPPRGDAVHEAILEIMLDVSHWPTKTIETGHRWERDLSTGWFKGRQRFEFAGVQQLPIGKVGVVRMLVEGEFDGALARSHRFDQARAVIYWANMDKMFAAYEGRIKFARRRPTGDETFQTRIELGLERHDTLTESQADMMRQELTVFSEALKRLNRKDYGGARDVCRQFRATWPGSVWRPAVDELEMQASAAAPRKRLKTSEVLTFVTQALVQWEAALEAQNYDLLDHTRESLVELTVDARGTLLKLIRADRSKDRAAAAFALAFSTEPGDFQSVQRATRDESARVRGMALTGIAARADPATSAEMLLLRMGDDKAGVRGRACRAVAACIPREHLSIGVIATKLNDLVAHDKSTKVRREAIRAIGAVGAPADIATLESAIEYERDEKNQAEIRRSIQRLKELL